MQDAQESERNCDKLEKERMKKSNFKLKKSKIKNDDNFYNTYVYYFPPLQPSSLTFSLSPPLSPGPRGFFSGFPALLLGCFKMTLLIITLWVHQIMFTIVLCLEESAC